MNRGYIKLWRKVEDWEWYHDDFMFKFFTYIIMKANIKDHHFEGRLIKRGQLVTGRRKLATKLRSSEQSVRTALDRLKSTNEITI